MMHRSLLLLACLSVAACARSSAPPLPGDSVAADGAVTLSPPRMSTAPRAPEPVGAIESKLYPAELIMDHQGEIALEPAQRELITKEIDRGQAELVRVQWELQSEKEKLVKVLDDAKVDEPKARAAAAQVMDRENKIKAAHLAMLVRIKNVLTPAQQEKLRVARDAERCAAPDAGR
jgi:Spy/CpxP family protein refolding chaperone